MNVAMSISESIYGSNVLLCHFSLGVFVFVRLFSIEREIIAIPCVFEILFESHQLDGFIGFHHFTKHLHGPQLRVIDKHDFFLYAAVSQSSSSQILICEVSLQMSVVIFNADLISFQFYLCHRAILIFLDNFFDFSFFYSPPDDKSLTIALYLVNFRIDVLNDCWGLVRMFFKNAGEIHQVTVSAFMLYLAVEFLLRDQAQHHGGEQVKNLLFCQGIVALLSRNYQRDGHLGSGQQKLGYFGVHIRKFMLVLQEQSLEVSGYTSSSFHLLPSHLTNTPESSNGLNYFLCLELFIRQSREGGFDILPVGKSLDAPKHKSFINQVQDKPIQLCFQAIIIGWSDQLPPGQSPLL